MGLFDFFKKKKDIEVVTSNDDNPTDSPNQVILAMPMFNNNESYDIHKVVDHLKTFWGFSVDDAGDVDNETAVFNVDGQMVAIAYMPGPIPIEEIEEVAPYNYYWKTAVEDLKNHTGHAIISILSGDKTNIERHIILSKMLCSILMVSNAIGIYQGVTTQLFSREYYLAFADDLKVNDVIPPLWIYFGIRNDDNGVSLYTYGLDNFGKLELEIINTKKEAGDMYEFIINIASYVLKNNVTFHNGETVGYTAKQKVPLTISKGIYVDKQSIKMEI